MPNIIGILNDLRAERDRLSAAIAALEGITSNRGRATGGGRKRRKMSASARAKIAAAQRARWAKVRKAAKGAAA